MECWLPGFSAEHLELQGMNHVSMKIHSWSTCNQIHDRVDVNKSDAVQVVKVDL